MHPRIEIFSEKKLVGKRIRMSLAHNKTFALWQSFMPQRKQIVNTVNDDLISMQVYPEPLQLGNLHQEFDKWAAIEVSNFNSVPSDMETYSLPSGLYAVFHYIGSSTDTQIFHFIFGTWLPASGYVLDNRPHLAIMGAKYKNNDTTSEEEICIPIKAKQS